MLETISKGQSPALIVCKLPLILARTRSAREAPATRKPTRATAGTVRRAILPAMGQVANKTCTAIRARCGAAALFDLRLRSTVTGFQPQKRSGIIPIWNQRKVELLSESV